MAKASAQAGLIFDSGHLRNLVPIWTALAPRASAAATPRASAIPPVATTGTLTASATAGTKANSPTSCRNAASGVERPPVAAGFHTLSNNHVCPRRLGRSCLSHGRDGAQTTRALAVSSASRTLRDTVPSPLTTRPEGAAASSASHWAPKFGSGCCVTRFRREPECPHPARNSPPRPTCAGSRCGAGSGIQRFIWKGPCPLVRTSSAQATISS